MGRGGKGQGGLEKDTWENWAQWNEVWGQNSKGGQLGRVMFRQEMDVQLGQDQVMLSQTLNIQQPHVVQSSKLPVLFGCAA